MSDIEVVRKRHIRWGHPDGVGGHCMADKQSWPCDTRIVLDALDELADRRTGTRAYRDGPCSTDLRCYRSDGHDGDHAYPEEAD